MKILNYTLSKLFACLSLCLLATAFTACDNDKNSDNPGDNPDGGDKTAYIRVSPGTLSFNAEGIADNSTGILTIEANCKWAISVLDGKSWLHLSATEGESNGTITVTVTPLSPGNTAQSAQLLFATTDALGTPATQQVTISLSAPEPPTPTEPIEITVDFQLGATVTTPELPPYSKENFVTGRHEYTIDGYTFAIFVDADENGKFYWIDNTLFNPSIPSPNKGLFFNKLGAYIEFPALEGMILTEVSYLPTTQQNTQTMALTNTDGSDAQYAYDIPEEGQSTVYTMIEPEVNTAYRIVVMDKKNAQCAKLKLTYSSFVAQ